MDVGTCAILGDGERLGKDKLVVNPRLEEVYTIQIDYEFETTLRGIASCIMLVGYQA